MRRIIAFVAKNEFLVGVMIVTALARVPSLFEPNWYGDEGIYLVLGQALRHGLVWYRDIHDNKPPLLYLLATIAGSVAYFRALLLVWMMVTLIFFDKLARNLVKGRAKQRLALLIFAVMTTIPMIEGNIANAEIFMILPTIIGVLLLSSKQNSEFRIQKYFWAGVCFSIAFLFKVPAIFELMAFVFFYWLFVKKSPRGVLSGIVDKKLWLLAAGFILPVALTFIYYWSKGALADYFFAAFTQNVGYLSSYRGPQSGLAVRGIILVLFCAIFWFFNRKQNKNFCLAMVWFAFAVFAAMLPERPYPHYLIQIVTSGSLLLATTRFDRWREWFFLTVAVAILAFSSVKYKFYFYPTLSYYKNFIGYISGKESLEEYNNFFDSRVNQTTKLTNYLRKITSSGDKIFVWADEPFIYVGANRLAVGKYIVAYHVVDFGAMDSTYQGLLKDKPKVIVISNNEKQDFSSLGELVNASYGPAGRFGDARVYFRLDK